MSDQQNLYTLAEAAELTGLSTEALRLRIKRGKLEAKRGNDGQPRVQLTSADLEDFRRQLAQQKPTLTRQDADRTNTVKALEAAVEALREQSGRERAALQGELAIAREELARERERAERGEARAAEATLRLDGVRERAATLAVEREEARIRAARLEGELEALRRPWWRKLIGQ
jgi:chromosome segregation ATPase